MVIKRGRRVIVTDNSTCAICKKRIGPRTVIVVIRYPIGRERTEGGLEGQVIVHFACRDRVYTSLRSAS